jgi:hypothetical protein
MSRLARRPPPSRPVIDFYASGLLHTEKDALGVLMVGAKPGIIAAANAGGKLRYEEKVPGWVADHLRAGGALFCDSGAFTVAFTDKNLDFNRVFRFYHQLLKLCRSPAQLTIVMPDVVGEQQRTLDLWNHYHAGIEWWLRRGCTCLFPMQGFEFALKQPGRFTLPEMYGLACGMFGQKVAAALPMKKAATKPHEALAFVDAVKPPHLHLLGMGRKAESVQLAVEMVRASPGTVITADAVETTTAYGGRHGWMTPAARAKIARREKGKGGKRRDIWYRDRVPGPDDAEVNWWLPTPRMGERWQDRFDSVVMELIRDGLDAGEITHRQADLAYQSPAYARKLFAKKFRATDAIMAMADHMMHRMAQTRVPQVNEVVR